jgi:hypothetical protein
MMKMFIFEIMVKFKLVPDIFSLICLTYMQACPILLLSLV